MAIDTFEEGISEVLLLQKLAVAAEAREEITAANTLCRAAIVLMVSHFEAFLKSLALEFIDSIGTGELEARRIPLGVREHQTLPRLKEVISSQNDPQRQALLRKSLLPLANLWNDNAKPAKGTLDADKFARIVTSAKSDVIDNLFKCMGSVTAVCDGEIEVTDHLGDIHTANIRFSIRDVVDCRNDIAHGTKSRTPTPADVTRYLLFVHPFAERLDRKAEQLSSSVLAD
ncbi:MAE_28990/MAE_18760 family HEPN-like nuclease [Mycetocola saprophilus]|uniref:MAE_28990/MAE_18760 family HEPN-like nuclease n=1 Tax=Mycetocola saprophilus TaxID=76636 RepID=UPI0012DDEB55|nr:MAE_28990/MAE_18760 family HEPN-like nuclease [Mycetocola saprophilus]